MSYDLIVIGAGPGGHATALEAAHLGRKVLIIENGEWGGTCTHRGCIPTKALLACSRRYLETESWKRLGITVENVRFDFSAARRHQRQMIQLSTLGIRKSLQDQGVTTLEGEAVIVAPGEVAVTDSLGKTVHAKGSNVVISWGSKASPLPHIPFSTRVINSDTLLQMDTLPKSLIAIGGGAIGVEFATFLAEVGTQVTLIECLAQILPYEDPDVADYLTGEMKKKGIEIHTATSVKEIVEAPGHVTLETHQGERTLQLSAEYVLVCTGRLPHLRETELKRLGIAYSSRGIGIDSRLETSVPGIYAVGDVTGGILLAHRAVAQGRSVVRSLFGESDTHYTDDAVPVVVYSHPPVARVGLTERRARELGINAEVRKKDYGANMIARTELLGRGFVKTIFHESRLIGAAIAGEQAPDLISSLSLAVGNKMTERELKNWIIPHPTLSELLGCHN
ncbi:MAG: dihydrolipoyl dehydrogenase [Deltaproteobacteria bacterium]|nr:dihydrolipoyl dehydrogenase [Deltaproteobacteria bacterium]